MEVENLVAGPVYGQLVRWPISSSLLFVLLPSPLHDSLSHRAPWSFCLPALESGLEGNEEGSFVGYVYDIMHDRRETTKTAADRLARLRPTFLSDRRNEDYLCTTREGEGRLAFLSITNRSRNRLAICLFFLSFQETDPSSVHRWVKAESSLYSWNRCTLEKEWSTNETLTLRWLVKRTS